ncbi:DUF2490 domain-containing protein [Lutibacter sp. TH_r2]|uniref:DUF2490 domain-containing protein n=1 Tax=Lutibacter sp. TH_r2 TaxID=3082083 RepID=UPI0029536514|nr:DUF2490 domain-containing protein [Lutibacter sp. TH_r2]MDV7186887.1 DUF2490 domain-containing protein [Lutibacter sp. TH_r2]
MKKSLLILLLIFSISKMNAQEVEVLEDSGAWLTFSNKFIITDNFYVAHLFQQRRVDFLKKTQSFLTAPSINYKLTPNLTVGIGYMLYRYFPNGKLQAAIKRDENRFFQHLTLSNKAGKFSLNNRLMFEERELELVSNGEISGIKKYNRIRYRFQVTTNLFKLKNDNYILGKLSNEIRIKFGTGITNPDFDQNNFAALIGYKLLKNSSIWAGYGRYYFKKADKTFISSNLLHLTLTYYFDLRKK